MFIKVSKLGIKNKMENYVISVSPFAGGLSCRINCIVSSIKLAEKTGRKLLLYWPKNSWCNCRFEDLFENNIPQISKDSLKKIINFEDYKIYKDDLRYFQNKEKFILINSSNFLGFSKQDLQLKFEKIPKPVQNDILNYLKELNIKRDILKIVNDFSKKNFNKETIGIHIRKGDFRTVKSKVGLVSPDEKFIEEIKKIIEKNKNSKFFLATEDKNTEEKFKEIFKGKIISYPKKTKNREEENSVREALIELLLLSKCKIILGNFGSTFTEMAWFFGYCKPEMRIIIDKNGLREHVKIKEEKNKMYNKIKKFIYDKITPKDIKILGKED